MQPYIDYRLVPNSTDEAAVLADLEAVSPKFKLDGVAVAATFDIDVDGDPRAAILAVSKKFNVSVMRLEWGYREDKTCFGGASPCYGCEICNPDQ